MKKIVLASVLALASINSASATSVSSSDSFGLAVTNWTHDLTLNQFNSALGILNSVTFNYSGQISSLFRLESSDAQAATVTANSQGQLDFDLPISRSLSLLSSQSSSVTAFDGTIDFGGTSGVIIGPVAANDSASITFSGATLTQAILEQVIGLSTFNINVSALGLSSASGAGNLISQINTQAQANIEVIYDYTVRTTTTVPEPASLALLGIGLAGLGLGKRKQAV